MNPATEAQAVADDGVSQLRAYAEQQGQPITCRGAGCFGCCKEPVLTAKVEAEYALELLTPEQRFAVAQRARAWWRQVKASGLTKEKAPHVVLWRWLNVWCPLLEDGKCMIYERRPVSCRVHLAAGDPDACFDDTRRLTQIFLSCEQLDAKTAIPLLAAGRVETDHLGVWLIELLTGLVVETAARQLVVTYEDTATDTLHMTRLK